MPTSALTSLASVWKKITECGASAVSKKPSEARTIILTNYLSLILSTTVFLLIVVRFLLFGILPSITVSGCAVLFLSPLALNAAGFPNLSRITLCWLPSIVFISVYGYEAMKLPLVLTSEYDGLRIYLLGISCLPYLVFHSSNWKLLLLGNLVPFLVILFCDSILNFFEIGHDFKGTPGDKYEMNAMRTMLAYFILSGSCYSLKRLVEKGDKQNALLIRELATKNRIIQQQVSAQLHEAASRLALATQAAGIGIWEGSYESDHVIWDQQMYQLFGLPYHPDPIVDWRSSLHPDERDRIGEELNQAIRENRPYSQEFRVFHPDGKIRHLYTFGKVLPTQQKASRMIGVCWDITERKLAEEQVLQSKANLYATINNTLFLIWSIDHNYQMLSCNNPFRNYIRQQAGIDVREGQALSQLSGQGIRVVEFSEPWLKHYQRALAGESFEITEHRDNRYFKFSLSPIIENADITGVSVFGEETTELKRRERELLEAHQQIGELKLVALRSVMNPHFIFNSLNSIQYFIMENDQLNAVTYLSTFSKLIRSVLNNSISNKVRLSEELEQLRHYVSLEQLRFETKFDFVLEVDPQLDVQDIEIPSMLLQPYVENAILHGLYNKLDHGTLRVSVKQAGKAILYEIEDDGVGREAAMNFRRKLNSHQSMGTALTEERLKLINAQSEASLKITDLEREGKAAGTRVQIWIQD